ncbi:hypothetical protein L6R52_22420 [Myxococcota bacterium]|nr:hypothetical protein [Myxococcota bacterium]
MAHERDELRASDAADGFDEAGADDALDDGRSLEDAVLVARLLFWAGRVADADRLLRPLVRTHPSRPELLRVWALVKHDQGQLTDAIRALDRLATTTPSEPSAMASLEVLHRLAQQPEADRRELELVGDEALVRTHRAQLDLERAFRLATQQKFTSAVALAEAVAERVRTVDPGLFKLALLEKALLLDGLGQFEGAIQTLERLGNTRGFEVDRDRLLALARTYERRGTPDDLARAQKVHAFLFDQTGAPEHLGRIARIARRRGDDAEAQHAERRFLQAFRREHLELTIDELLEASRLHYVPLAVLRSLVAPEDELGAALAAAHWSRDPRRRAMLLALEDQRDESAAIFADLVASGRARPVDLKYFADLRAEEGDAEGARALYLAALSEEDAGDVEVLGRLLASESSDVDELVRPMFHDPDKRRATHEALVQAAKGHQRSPEVWRTLARFERLVGRAEDAERHAAKAAALAEVRPEVPIGRVQVAAVYELHGRKRGMVHEIWAARHRVGIGRDGGLLDESSIFGNVAPDMMRDIQNVFVAVRAFVEHKFPHLVGDLRDYRYVLKVTKDDEPSGGSSAGVAVALAFVSVFLQRPVRQDVAITGAVVVDSSSEIRVHRVADVDYKVLGVHQRRLAHLALPEENRADLEASDLVPRPIWERRAAFVRNLTQVMKVVFGDDVWEW